MLLHMKLSLVSFFFTVLACLAQAQQPSPAATTPPPPVAPPPKATPAATPARVDNNPVKLPVNTADIRDIQLTGGSLTFTAEGRRFSYEVRTIPMGNDAAAIAAGSAVLSELRRATTVILSVKLSPDPKRISDIVGITFKYDNLKQ